MIPVQSSNQKFQKFETVSLPIWKKLPKRTLKMKIHNLLFLNLQNQDSYADIDSLIYEIKKDTILQYNIYIYNLFSLSSSISFGYKSLIFFQCCFFCLLDGPDHLLFYKPHSDARKNSYKS